MHFLVVWLLAVLFPLPIHACVTPAGIPCATLTYAETRWENKSWGFHNVERHEAKGIQVYRADGARAIHGEQTTYGHYLFPLRESKGIFLDLPDRTVGINHDRKEIHIHPRRKQALMSRVSVARLPDCSTPAHTVKKGFPIAGHETYELTYLEIPNTIIRTYRAPALGCLTLKEVTWEYNRFGIPTRFREWKAESVDLAPPAPHLFDIPSTYHPRKP